MSENSVRVVLVRAYSDLSNVGYYSVLHEDECVTILPIVERRELRAVPAFMEPSSIVDKCTGRKLSTYYKFSRVGQGAIHNDPRIEMGFYTEDSRPSRLSARGISRGAVLLFMTGLAKYPEDVWLFDLKVFRKVLRRIREENKVGLYVVGGIVVDRVVSIDGSSYDWSRAVEEFPVLMYSPHYYRSERGSAVAFVGRGFFVNPPLKIATVTSRGYRISRSLYDLVGRGVAMKLARQNFRKSSLVEVPVEAYERVLGSRVDFA